MPEQQPFIREDAGAALVRKLLHTREVRRLLGSILPEVLNVYAGQSRVRRFAARVAGKHLSRSLSRPGDVFQEREIEKLLADEAFIREVVRFLPEMADSLLNLAATAAATIDGIETGAKKELLGDLVARMSSGQTGGLITRGCRIVNDIHTDDPEFFTRVLEPGLRKWIESVDFGELKEAVDHSAGDVRAFVAMANSVLWEYPAKVVMILSLLPSVVNMLAESLDISLNRLNELPPDLLTDVVLSLVQDIDARPLSRLINELAEAARKIHTGSALLGEPGSPRLPWVLSGKIDEVVDHVDPVVLWKARMALAETGATVNRAMAEAVNRNTELKRLSMRRRPEMANIRVKTFNQSLSWWDGVGDDETAASFSQNLSAYDLQELADAINGVLHIFNRIGDRQPELLPRFIDRFVAAIDDDALAAAASKLFGDADEEAPSPAARAVLPQLVVWAAKVLAPADDAYEDDARQARDALQTLFAAEEV